MNRRARDISLQVDGPALESLLAGAQTLFVAGGVAFPHALVDWLNERPELTAGKRIVFGAVAGFDHPVLRAPRARVEVFFRLPSMADAEEIELVPIQYRRLADWLRSQSFDLVLARTAAPVGGRESVSEGGGGWPVGVGCDFLPAACAGARELAVEVDRALPVLAGAPKVVHGSVVQVAMSRVGPQIIDRGPAPDEVSARIAQHVASLVQDGDCIQLGVGAIPEAVLSALEGHRDLGVHSGLISDGVMSLVEKGVVNGRRKSIDQGLHVAGFLLGSQQLYDWAADHEDLRLRPVEGTHDVRVISALENFVSVNSAVQVDLLGQINAEMVRGRQISGVGGSIDYFQAAGLSRGGRSIVALPSTAARGRVSRIVARIDEGVVTAPRTAVDFVATEHGVAELRGATVRERAERLLRVCDPGLRDGVRRDAEGD